jgi:glutamate formiminotransferase/formiminotetrahydrofolate cyclodeaminase
MKKNMPSGILECIPNFSEGQDNSIINKIQKSIAGINGVKILHADKGFSANRTVITFAGEPEAVMEAAFQGIKTAAELIDMQKHKGIHPRIGATDVVPLVPVRGISMQEAVRISHLLANRVGSELNIPVYCYEKSALIPKREKIENIRKGEYEGLKEKISKKLWKPDFGPAIFNAKTGATIIGARHILVAYNVNLNTRSAIIAAEIAARIRKSGKTIIENGQKKKVPGLLNSVKAIGWYIEEYQKAQVSMNLTNLKNTSMHKAFETIKEIAKELDCKVTGSELIGLVPEKALVDAGLYYASFLKSFDTKNKEALIKYAVEKLGLSAIKPFHPKERIIENMLEI